MPLPSQLAARAEASRAASSAAAQLAALTSSPLPPAPPLLKSPDWDQELVAALTSVADARSVEEAKGQLPELLGKLGDPFTRWLPSRWAALLTHARCADALLLCARPPTHTHSTSSHPLSTHPPSHLPAGNTRSFASATTASCRVWAC